MKALLKTNFGDITVALNEEKAPISSENFTNYVKEGFYNGVIFHRVIDNFMVQGGGFTPDMQQKTTKECIKNEANNGLKNKIGTLAMARTPDPHSASSQFFINVADNDFLNFTSESESGWGYAVFAEVVEGMDVVNQMKGVATTNKFGHGDVPAEDIIINEAVLID